MKEMKLKTRILLNVVLGIVLVGIIVGLVFWSIYVWHLDHNLFLKEYNAQIEKFGYYKEDIHLLDLAYDKVALGWNEGGLGTGWVIVVVILIVQPLAGIVGGFNSFRKRRWY